MNVLVTGANSPLGLAVCKAALNKGYKVSGTLRAPSSFSKIFDDLENLYYIDLTSPSDVDQISEAYDAFVHVAAKSDGSPKALFMTNAFGTLRLIKKAIELGVRKFVHVSSMSVYGSVQTAVVDINTPIKHCTPYGLSKWAAECYSKMYEGKLEVVSVRSPAIVGAIAQRHFLANALTSLLNQDATITLYNPDFEFNNVVHEKVEAEFLLDLCLDENPLYRAFPIGSCEPLPLRNIIEMMISATSYKGEIIWLPSGTPPFSIDSSAAISSGYCPISTHDTIKRWLADCILLR